MKATFTHIIKTHQWRDTICGSGSTLQYTEPLRSALPDFLRKHKITSMFDAPCGDYSWMSQIDLPATYIGGDIVDFMIEDNRTKYPNVDFRVFDLSQDTLPDVDLLFCRDCLFHLSYADIRKVFEQIAASNVKYVLTTSFVVGANKDITTGGFRELNLEQAPYNFAPPIDAIDDYIAGEPARRMCLWTRETFEDFLK